MNFLGLGLSRTELSVFMDVFEDVGELEEDSFMTCSQCGKQVWNRGETLCQACSKKLSRRFKKLLIDYTEQVSDLRFVASSDEGPCGEALTQSL